MTPSDAGVPGGIESALAWPPPGLGSLQGAIHRLARRLALANAVLLTALFMVGNVVPVDRRAGLRIGGLLALAGVAFGWLLLALAARRVGRTVNAGSQVVWRGYTWLTLTEVMADRHGDAGALIEGSGAYAAIPAPMRSRRRAGRIAAALAEFAVGLGVIPLFFGLVWIGALLHVPVNVALAVAAIAGFAFVLTSTVRGGHATSAPTDDAELNAERRTRAIQIADAWYARFDVARAGQPLGRGRPGGAVRAWILSGIVTGVIACTPALVAPVCLLAAFGSDILRSTYLIPHYENTFTKMGRLANLRALLPAPEPAIAPSQAGEAFNAMTERPNEKRAPYERPVPRTFLPFPKPDSIFARPMLRSGWNGPRSPDILTLAHNGLTPAQRTYLMQLAANPVWGDYELFARAPRVDFVAGRFLTPFPATLSPASLPLAPFSTLRELVQANTARAALYLADRRPADAERVLRETIAVGFHLTDDGTEPFDMQFGQTIIGIGRDALIRFYDLTNDPRGRTLRNEANARAQFMEPGASSVTRDRAMIVRGLTDTQLSRESRFSLVQASGLAQCGNARELLLGPSSDIRSAYAVARKQLARSPAEAALFDLFTHTVDRPIPFTASRGQGPVANLLMFGATVSGWVLRNPRIRNCTGLLLGRY